jgi:hypothetical protein
MHWHATWKRHAHGNGTHLMPPRDVLRSHRSMLTVWLRSRRSAVATMSRVIASPSLGPDRFMSRALSLHVRARADAYQQVLPGSLLSNCSMIYTPRPMPTQCGVCVCVCVFCSCCCFCYSCKYAKGRKLRRAAFSLSREPLL